MPTKKPTKTSNGKSNNKPQTAARRSGRFRKGETPIVITGGIVPGEILINTAYPLQQLADKNIYLLSGCDITRVVITGDTTYDGSFPDAACVIEVRDE